MTPLAILPSWFPTEAAFLAVVVAIALVVAWNRGNRWMVNLLATDEPVLAAIGVFLLLAAGWFIDTLGLSMVPVEAFWLVGVAAIAVAMIARYTDHIDISGLVG